MQRHASRTKRRSPSSAAGSSSSRQPGDAVAALKRALAIDPARIGALSLLQQAVAAGQWSDAEAWLARIADAWRSVAILRLGWQAEEGLGNHDQAIVYARAIGAHGNADEARKRETQSSSRPTEPPMRWPWPTRGSPRAADPSARSTLRVLRAAAGSADPLTDLRQALLDDPQNSEASAPWPACTRRRVTSARPPSTRGPPRRSTRRTRRSAARAARLTALADSGS